MNLIEALQKQMTLCKEKENYKCGVYVISSERRKIVMEVISNITPRPNRDIDLRMGANCAEARWRNGSVLRIIYANDGARGHRLNGVIIDNELSNEVIRCVVMPTLRPILLDAQKFEYEDDKELMNRFYTVDISYDDVNKSKEYMVMLPPNESVLTKAQQESLGLLMKNWTKKIEKEKIMFTTALKDIKSFDSAYATKELNNDKVMIYLATGIPSENITYKTEFVNKTKQTYLNINGEVDMGELGFKNEIHVHLLIDTDIYEGYEVIIKDGTVMVVLHEILNTAPILKDYSAN